jgi:hypothetical protein
VTYQPRALPWAILFRTFGAECAIEFSTESAK